MMRLLSQPREAPRLPPDLNRAMVQPSMLVAGRQAWHASRLRPLAWVPRCLSCAPLCANVWPPLASNPSPNGGTICPWLLLDSRGVDLTIAYHSIFASLYLLEVLIF